jgi:hypothetical protein
MLITGLSVITAHLVMYGIATKAGVNDATVADRLVTRWTSACAYMQKRMHFWKREESE